MNTVVGLTKKFCALLNFETGFGHAEGQNLEVVVPPSQEEMLLQKSGRTRVQRCALKGQ